MPFLKINSCFGLSSVSLVDKVNKRVHETVLANENRRHKIACLNGNSDFYRSKHMLTAVDYR